MTKLSLLILSGTLWVSLPAGAQVPFAGPSLGFIFDAPGQALRPIRGIPGAAVFGDAVAFPSPVSMAAISLKHNVAIVDDGAWQAMVTSAGSVATVTLPDGLPDTAQVVLSETGATAGFYDSDNGALSVVTGIVSGNPAVASMGLTSLPGAITQFAPSDDGSVLLTAAVAGGGEALIWLGPDGSSRQLANLQKAASIVLWNHGASALVVDHDANQVWRVQDPGGNAAISLVASDADGVAGPTGAAASADGSRIWIANTGAHGVLGIDPVSRATVVVACSVDPAALVPLADGQTFRLNDLNGGPVWVLDTAPGSDPRIVFIPAVPSPADEVAQ